MLRGLIFDMDGTLIEPAIDFMAMREAIGVLEGDILLELARWERVKREHAFGIIETFEQEAAANMMATRGVIDYLTSSKRAGVCHGLITRNTHDRVAQCARLLGATFTPALDRTFAPLKPDPASILHILAAWGFEPEEVVMFGDSGQDMHAAHAAGVKCAVIAREYNAHLRASADWYLESFEDLPAELKMFSA